MSILRGGSGMKRSKSGLRKRSTVENNFSASRRFGSQVNPLLTWLKVKRPSDSTLSVTCGCPVSCSTMWGTHRECVRKFTVGSSPISSTQWDSIIYIFFRKLDIMSYHKTHTPRCFLQVRLQGSKRFDLWQEGLSFCPFGKKNCE